MFRLSATVAAQLDLEGRGTGCPLMLQDRQDVIRAAPVTESEPPVLQLDVCREAGPIRAATAARSPRFRVLWLALWSAGAIASYIAAALMVRALAKSLSVFEMMSLR